MALADTARLVASLELEDKFSKNVDKFDKSLGSMDRKTKTLQQVGFRIGQGARTAVDNIGKIALAGGGLIASQVALGVRSLVELQEVTNQTNAVIESTAGAANVSAAAIREHAEELENLSTVDDKVIQAGQNILLTFTNVRNEVGKGNDIFTQATETLLDMSVALGSEPKQAAIQLGKALNDPIKGITALTRVGVTFTEEQKKEIEQMVKHGRTLEAQKVIIQELNREFGGSAEAFGQGPGAAMRRFGDAVEGAQQALATGFLPLIEKVSERVQEFLSNPEVIRQITAFGESAAQGVDQLIDIGTKLPWDAIGASAKLMGEGAKALLNAFTSLPPWVQTAVLTGWGLNKLTGGAIGSIAGALTKGAFGALRGSTPATPVFTKEVGVPGVGGGGGTPVATGGRGIGGALLGGAAKVIGVAIAAEVGREIGKSAFFDPAVAPAVRFEDSQFQQFLNNPKATQNAQVIQHNLDNVEGAIHQLIGKEEEGRIIGEVLFGEQLHKLDDQRSILQELLVNATHYASSSANRWSQEQSEAYAQLNSMNRANAALNGVRNQVGVSNARLSTIAAKDFSPNVNVAFTANTSVSISEVTRAAVSNSFASGFTPRLLNG